MFNWLRRKEKKSASFDDGLLRVEIEPQVAHRFNAYARAAWPREIGGLLRLKRKGNLICVDELRIFEHLHASGGYFELDGADVALFLIELSQTGRADEIGRWRGLIHSHPNMDPFLSGTDQENLWRLAGEDWALSVICAARQNPIDNFYGAHYAETSPSQALVRNLPVSASGRSLAGLSTISGAEEERIAAQVRQMFSSISPGHSQLLS